MIHNEWKSKLNATFLGQFKTLWMMMIIQLNFFEMKDFSHLGLHTATKHFFLSKDNFNFT